MSDGEVLGEVLPVLVLELLGRGLVEAGLFKLLIGEGLILLLLLLI